MFMVRRGVGKWRRRLELRLDFRREGQNECTVGWWPAPMWKSNFDSRLLQQPARNSQNLSIHCQLPRGLPLLMGQYNRQKAESLTEDALLLSWLPPASPVMVLVHLLDTWQLDTVRLTPLGLTLCKRGHRKGRIHTEFGGDKGIVNLLC